MPLASHLRCVALALGISTALGCANRNQPAPRAESLDPGLSRVAGTRGDALPAQWWTLYQDPGLNHLVAAALRHNRDLAAADAHARALLGHLRGAQGERWPRTEVGYGYQYGRDGDDQTLAEATDEDLHSQWKHTVRLDLSYQLDLWGEVRARIAAAKADAEAAQAARDLLRVSVASQTTLAYVRACALARRAEVQRRSVGLLDASLALSERQLAAGLSSELQRRRLLALRERTRAALPMLEARRRAALYELALLSGRSPRQLDAPAATCAGIPQLRRALPTEMELTIVAAFELEFYLIDQERRLAAADARRALAEAELYPRISFAVGAETSAATLAGLGGSGALAYAAGPLLSWRFPNRESARGRLDSAAAERDAALARFDGAVLGALREVERALALYAGERQRRADLQRALDEQRHAYRLARSNYRAGALDALELLDSQRSLVADRARLVDAEMRVAERQVELFRALGGGWQAASSPSHQENGQ
ncbi:TolC family protein [Pseudomonas aeruginosa]|uniref:TolC family protein n=68 Tax=Gammaproteobacteria TaxID=1236 RepID=UPI0032642B64